MARNYPNYHPEQSHVCIWGVFFFTMAATTPHGAFKYNNKHNNNNNYYNNNNNINKNNIINNNNIYNVITTLFNILTKNLNTLLSTTLKLLSPELLPGTVPPPALPPLLPALVWHWKQSKDCKKDVNIMKSKFQTFYNHKVCLYWCILYCLC